jgi:hypothetical protein
MFTPIAFFGGKVISNEGTFIACSLNGTNRLMKSSDGINWTSITTGDNGGQWIDLTWARNKNIIVAVDFNRGTTSKIMYSTNGTTWNTSTIGSSAARFYYIAYSPSLGKFSAVVHAGVTTNRVYYSDDGINFTSGSISNRTWTNIIWAETFGLFLAHGRTGGSNTPPIIASSTDGETYTDRYTSSTNDDQGAIGYSPSLGTNGRAVLLSRTGNTGRYSDDGIDWSETVSHPSITLFDIAWSEELNIFVAVGQGGAASSTDGINWTSRTVPESGNWMKVTWSKHLSKFVAVASNTTNRVMYSTNGTSWTSASAAEANLWFGIIYTDGLVF